jgi:hypothetical protein
MKRLMAIGIVSIFLISALSTATGLNVSETKDADIVSDDGQEIPSFGQPDIKVKKFVCWYRQFFEADTKYMTYVMVKFVNKYSDISNKDFSIEFWVNDPPVYLKRETTHIDSWPEGTYLSIYGTLPRALAVHESVTVIADSDNDISEYDESNNEKTFYIDKGDDECSRIKGTAKYYGEFGFPYAAGGATATCKIEGDIYTHDKADSDGDFELIVPPSDVRYSVGIEYQGKRTSRTCDPMGADKESNLGDIFVGKKSKQVVNPIFSRLFEMIAKFFPNRPFLGI